jgi:hypothetical protein
MRPDEYDDSVLSIDLHSVSGLKWELYCVERRKAHGYTECHHPHLKLHPNKL